jgi:hypothetical protein
MFNFINNDYNKISIFKVSIFLTLCIELTSAPKGISFPIFGNIIGFVFLFFLLIRNITQVILTLVFTIFIFLFYLLYNPNYYINSFEPYKALFYALVAILFSVEYRKKDMIKILTQVFFNYLILITILYFLGYGIDDAGGSLRIQGLMSEPSALSLILCFLFWFYIKEKNYKKLFFVLFVSLLTMSLTVYIHFVLFYFVRLVLNLNSKSFIKLTILFFLILLSYVLLINIQSDYWLINKLQDAILFIQSGGMEGKNTRIIEKSIIYDDQNQSSLSFYIGNGPNFGVYYYTVIRGMVTNTHNLIIILFFNFGIIGAAIGVIWLLFSFIRMRKSHYSILFISAATYSLINTASGIVNEVYLFSLLFYSLDLIFHSENLQFLKMKSYTSIKSHSHFSY